LGDPLLFLVLVDKELKLLSSYLLVSKAFCSFLCLFMLFREYDRHREISSSHGGKYEAQNLLGCTAVFLIECQPTQLPDDGGSNHH
jgi:hypothetical protein